MSVQAGKLGDRIYTADLHTECRWGFPVANYGVKAEIWFWNQEDADHFAAAVQVLLERVDK